MDCDASSSNSSAAEEQPQYSDSDIDQLMEDAEDEDEQQSSSSKSYGQAKDNTSPGELHKRKKREYEILPQSDVRAELEQQASECASILGLSIAHCKHLLGLWKWQNMVLCERFCETTDQSDFLRQYGLLPPLNENNKSATEEEKPTTKYALRIRKKSGDTSQNEKDEKKKMKMAANVEEKNMCRICFESNRELKGLLCAHDFCEECWIGYLQQKIASDGQCRIACAEPGCDLAADDQFVRKLLAGKKCHLVLLQKYDRLQLDAFVGANPLMKWCPAANCGRAIKVQLAEPMRIKCDCGYQFCFSCIHEWHAPISCNLLRIWLKQCSDDSETFHWINAFTKDCPKCKTAIEKNGGCNHMTCRSKTCGYEFCWVCMGDWKKHSGNYSCNRFTEEQARRDSRAEESRSALTRYLHYYERHRNHENSLKLEHKLYERVARMVNEFKEANFRHIETLFLDAAVDALVESRRTLMYTYAFAFYLKQDCITTTLFEDNQRDLELATEQLSEYLERDLAGENDLNGLKQKVQDKARYVDSRRQILLQHCIDGTEHDEWKYNREGLDPKDGTVPYIG